MTDFSLPGLGPLAWIDVVLLGWFALTALSVLYVAYDTFHNPEANVMKWGWILVTLYMGPLAVGLYILADKEPRPGGHEEFIKPLWRQGIGSTIHCVAGDATGIILAATITALLGFPMWIDLIAEYVFGFAFGLLIFQALFMKDMFGGSYWRAVRHSFMPEWLSMNMMMAGMVPVMVLLMMGRDMRAMEPTELLYWGTMSLGVIVGFATAYPVNVWLVAVGLKHGLSTVRKVEPQQQALLAEPLPIPTPALMAADNGQPAPTLPTTTTLPTATVVAQHQEGHHATH